MPEVTNTAPTPALTDTTSIKAQAQAKYSATVVKELTSKYSAIEKRKSQLAAFNDRVNKLFSDFETALAEAGDNPAKVKEVLEAHKFPASVLAFNPKQSD